MNRFVKTMTALVAATTLLGAAWAQGLGEDLTVRMGEMYFQIEGQEKNAPIELEAGVPYRITFVNEGDVEHRVKFGRSVEAEEGVPFDYAEHLFDGVFTRATGMAGNRQFSVDTGQLLELDVQPGAVVLVSFTLPTSTRGEWEIGCFVPATRDTPNHYIAGMRAPLIIE
ncbi:MAG: hypothetical protein U5K81_02890 [Trueperaceae bacterium]|nr:hypothetical protein [Trueperaceae bacterium]